MPHVSRRCFWAKIDKVYYSVAPAEAEKLDKIVFEDKNIYGFIQNDLQVPEQEKRANDGGLAMEFEKVDLPDDQLMEPFRLWKQKKSEKQT